MSTTRTSYCPYALLLEDARGQPAFWSGSETVAKLVWRLSPYDFKKLEKLVIAEVLEKFAGQNYIRACSVTWSPGPEKARPVRVSDNFLTLWSEAGKKQKSVKLILNPNRQEAIPREISSKFLLILSEMHKKRVFWDGKKPVFNFIYRVQESQMLVTIENTLRKFLALDYLRHPKTKFEAITGKNEEAKVIKRDDILGSLFSGTSVQLRLSLCTGSESQLEGVVAPKEQAGSNDTGDTEAHPLMPNPSKDENANRQLTEELVQRNSLSSFWVKGNWQEIREKVQHQLDTVDRLKAEGSLPSGMDESISEQKQLLETAVRRRNRSVEEVWRHYSELKQRLDAMRDPAVPQRKLSSPLAQQGMIPRQESEPVPPSDSSSTFSLFPNGIDVTQTTTSCIDFVASAMRGFGIEILDEDQRATPLAGIAFTTVLVIAICVASRCVQF